MSGDGTPLPPGDVNAAGRGSAAPGRGTTAGGPPFDKEP
jgi:hypothetical protein